MFWQGVIYGAQEIYRGKGTKLLHVIASSSKTGILLRVRLMDDLPRFAGSPTRLRTLACSVQNSPLVFDA